MSNMQNTILISTGIVASLPLIPIGHFLRYGWPARKEQITSRFSNDSIELYRKIFYPISEFTNSQEFKQEYDKRYGRQLFWFPVALFGITLLFLVYKCISWLLMHGQADGSDSTAKIATSSLAGAYVWVTYDLILRVRQNDVVTSDVNRATLRLLVSLPFGFAITAFAGVFGENSKMTLGAAALAFFVGAFPTDTVLKFMRRTAGTQLKLDADAGGDNVQLLTTPGCISVPIAERLIDEGVKTKLQLAYADPIALTIKTGMDFSYILDCCGQALVSMYFSDDQMKVVNKFGFRTGVEIAALTLFLDQYDKIIDAAALAGTAPAPRNTGQAAADAQLQSFSNQLQMDTQSVRFILNQIVGDPYTTFACKIWDS
jgi:hypothetical protein